jgi:hypothetical protein
MPGRRRALDAIADLLGLPPVAVRAVERRTNGDYAIVLRQPRAGNYAAQAMPRWTWSRRALRIPRTRVEGYRQRSPWARERDVRARRRANAKRSRSGCFGGSTPRRRSSSAPSEAATSRRSANSAPRSSVPPACSSPRPWGSCSCSPSTGGRRPRDRRRKRLPMPQTAKPCTPVRFRSAPCCRRVGAVPISMTIRARPRVCARLIGFWEEESET